MSENTESSLITIDEFARIDIRVGLVIDASPVKNSKKLIQLTVDFANGIGSRTILTGLLAHFPDMDAFVGKKFLFLINLTPRTMAGIESQGMFLAADTPDGPRLLEQSSSLPIGSKIR
jgi:methionine--tRNA ligase beta chain